jgi:hypothetical protein
LTDENLREPIANAQQHNRSKESYCDQTGARAGKWHRVDQQLDEELKDTFPASDALSVTRNPSGR